MKNEELENMVSITEFSKQPSKVLKKTESGNSQYILKNNKVVAVLMDIELFKAINEASKIWHPELDGGEWENIVDYAETLAAVNRAAAEPGTPLNWEKLLEGRDFTEGDL